MAFSLLFMFIDAMPNARSFDSGTDLCFPTDDDAPPPLSHIPAWLSIAATHSVF